MTYWDWWVGALALSAVTVGFSLIRKQPLGVSGSWARIVLRNHDKTVDAAELPFRKNPGLLKDALMRATIDEFGQAAVINAMHLGGGNRATVSPPADLTLMPIRVKWTAHFSFLFMLMVGGALAKLLSGDFSFQLTLGEMHSEFFGTGFGYMIILFTGGALVGFGTQLAGGCTSGHALSGVPRLVPASLIATATFFASAIIASLLIHYL